MKTDKFLQGILVSDENELFSYQYHKPDHGLGQVVKRLRKLKKNLVNLKYVTGHNSHTNPNKQAVFSKTTIDGNIEEAIADVWKRLHIKHDTSDDIQS